MDDSQKISTSNFYTKNNIFDFVDNFIAKHNLLPNKRKVTVVLACSGGPDSVFLGTYLGHSSKKEQYSVILVYIDHEWRAESKKEVEFCKNLAEKSQFLFETTTLDQIKIINPHIKMNGSKESYARELRYTFLQGVAKKHNADAIFLGHHQDDQIETFFIRAIRGTSLTGLCGIKPKSGIFVRPLLSIKKIEIITFLEQNNIPYCIDSSNEDHRYLRNRIRNKLIPTLEEIDVRSKHNIRTLIERLQNAEDCLDKFTKESFEKIATKKNNNIISVDIRKLLDLPKDLQYRVLLHFLIMNKISTTYSERLFEEILRFLKNRKANTHKISISFVLKKMAGSFWISI